MAAASPPARAGPPGAPAEAGACSGTINPPNPRLLRSLSTKKLLTSWATQPPCPVTPRLSSLPGSALLTWGSWARLLISSTEQHPAQARRPRTPPRKPATPGAPTSPRPGRDAMGSPGWVQIRELHGAAQPEPAACVPPPLPPSAGNLHAGKPPEPLLLALPTRPSYTQPECASSQATTSPNVRAQTAPPQAPAGRGPPTCRAQKSAPPANKGLRAGKDPRVLGHSRAGRSACPPAGLRDPRATRYRSISDRTQGHPRRTASCPRSLPGSSPPLTRTGRDVCFSRGAASPRA